MPAYTTAAKALFGNLGVAAVSFDASTDAGGVVVSVGTTLYQVSAAGAVSRIGPVRTSVTGQSAQFVLGNLAYTGTGKKQCSGV